MVWQKVGMLSAGKFNRNAWKDTKLFNNPSRSSILRGKNIPEQKDPNLF